MARLVFVWLPEWPIERLRRQAMREQGREAGCDVWPEARERGPFALVEPGPGGLTLHAVNGPARCAGLRGGQTLADARAAFPGLLTAPADLSADARTLVRLALWAGRYGPARNVLGADGLWIDITGGAHLFGGETALALDLAGRLAGFGLTAHVGLAATLGAACALARYGCGAASIEGRRPSSPQPGTRPWTRRIAIAGPDATAEALAPLPVEGLRLDPAAVLLLKRLGLRRIGALYPMPRAALEERFRHSDASRRARGSRSVAGLAGAVLSRLDQALGRSEEVLVPLVESPVHVARLLFADPLISSAGIEQAVARLALTLTRQLADARLGARRFTLVCYRCDGTVGTVGLRTQMPTDDGTHVGSLLIERLRNFDAGFGIDGLTLAARWTERIEQRQGALDERTRGVGLLGGGHGAGTAPDRLIDRLVNRLGADRVIRLVPVPSHIPECAEQRRSALDVSGHHDPPSGWPSSRGPRPALMLVFPEPVTVLAEVPDGAPLRFTWRRRTYRVVRTEGPERIAPEWWRHLPALQAAAEEDGEAVPSPRRDGGSPEVRDYYRLEDDRGGRFWIFRSGLYGTEVRRPPLWFIHGLFA